MMQWERNVTALLLGACVSCGDGVGPSDVDGNGNDTSTVGDATHGLLSTKDQVVDPTNRVVVSEVRSVGPGWVLIVAGLTDSAVLGFVSVSGGTTRDLPITVSRKLTDGEALHAKLYSDGGIVGTAEFGAADFIVTDGNGAPIVSTFKVSVESP